MKTISAAEAARLPTWAEAHPSVPNTVLVDPDRMYPSLLAEYGVEKADKYWIEVCYQSMKMDLQMALRRYGFTIHVRGDDGRAARWKLASFPGHPLDIVRATKGLEAKDRYRALRGFVPA